MSLSLSPVELVLYYNDLSSRSAALSIRNSSAEPVAFKIKTSSPLCFTVCPANGLVLPQQRATVTIALELAEESSVKHHKFQLQAVPTNSQGPVRWDLSLTQAYKFKVIVAEKCQTHRRNSSSAAREQINFLPRTDELLELEQCRERLVTQLLEQEVEIRKFEEDIGKLRAKLAFRREFEELVPPSLQKYSYRHMFTVMLLGFMAAYCLF